MQAEALVRDYLTRLDAAAQRLPDGRRRELTAEIGEHIDAALAEEGHRDEATVRNVLDRLGPPEDIVAAEAGQPVTPAAPERRRRFGVIEVAALLLLTIGAFALPIIGPVMGLVLVWLSTALTTREKLIVSVVAVVVLILPILGLLAAGGGSSVEAGILP